MTTDGRGYDPADFPLHAAQLAAVRWFVQDNRPLTQAQVHAHLLAMADRIEELQRRLERPRMASGGLVEVVRMEPATVPHPVDDEHPPADFDG